LILAGAVDGRFAAIRPDGRGNVTATHVVWSVEDDVPAICSPVSNEELVFLVNSGGLLLCYEVATGRKLWEKDLGAHFQASPTIAGDYLFLLEESGEMSALKVGRQYEFVSRSSLGEPCAASPAFQPGRIYLRGSAHVYCLGNR
jgi:outer membrane protein assembly factor BamB